MLPPSSTAASQRTVRSPSTSLPLTTVPSNGYPWILSSTTTARSTLSSSISPRRRTSASTSRPSPLLVWPPSPSPRDGGYAIFLSIFVTFVRNLATRRSLSRGWFAISSRSRTTPPGQSNASTHVWASQCTHRFRPLFSFPTFSSGPNTTPARIRAQYTEEYKTIDQYNSDYYDFLPHHAVTRWQQVFMWSGVSMALQHAWAAFCELKERRVTLKEFLGALVEQWAREFNAQTP